MEKMGWALDSYRIKMNGYLFCIYRVNPKYQHTNKSDNMKPEQVTGFFVRISRKIGFAAGAHRFRHTLATELCNPEDGLPPDIFAAQDILGHLKLETTRGYVLTDIRRMGQALERLPTTTRSKFPNTKGGFRT